MSGDDLNDLITMLYNKIDTRHTSLDEMCVATSVRELCESCDVEYIIFIGYEYIYS